MLDVIIDLSHHNSVTDWSAIKHSGIVGVIHKATQGTSYVDPTYHERRAAAKQANLLWGAYHFGEHGSGLQQVDHFLDTVRPTPLDLLVLDFEACGADTMLLTHAEAFVADLYRRTGRWCGLYSGMSFCTDAVAHCTVTPLVNSWLWLARYSTYDPVAPPPWETWSMWQYTDQGTVPGVQGFCDRDRFNGTMEGLLRLWGVREDISRV